MQRNGRIKGKTGRVCARRDARSISSNLRLHSACSGPCIPAALMMMWQRWARRRGATDERRTISEAGTTRPDPSLINSSSENKMEIKWKKWKVRETKECAVHPRVRRMCIVEWAAMECSLYYLCVGKDGNSCLGDRTFVVEGSSVPEWGRGPDPGKMLSWLRRMCKPRCPSRTGSIVAIVKAG